MNTPFSATIFLLLILILLMRGPLRGLWVNKACSSYGIKGETDWEVKPSAEEIRMLILADTGSGNERQRMVANASEETCRERGCDLVLLGGDNFIQQGVSSLDDELWKSRFEFTYRINVPFFAVLGNHDIKGNWRAQIDYTGRGRWHMPATSYDVTAGPVLVQAINTSCTFKTLWRLFRRSDRPWRLVLGHHPVLSSGRHGGMTRIEQFVVARSGIDFFVSGHNHVLEHLEIRNFDQIISGGGGSPIKKSARERIGETKFFLEDFGYVWARFTHLKASFYYFDIRGKEIYSFTRQRKSDGIRNA